MSRTIFWVKELRHSENISAEMCYLYSRTSSTIEVAHFGEYVNTVFYEKRGSLTQNRRNRNDYLVLENDIFVYLGHEINHRDAFDFCWGQFSGEVWSSLSEEPHDFVR